MHMLNFQWDDKIYKCVDVINANYKQIASEARKHLKRLVQMGMLDSSFVDKEFSMPPEVISRY